MNHVDPDGHLAGSVIYYIWQLARQGRPLWRGASRAAKREWAKAIVGRSLTVGKRAYTVVPHAAKKMAKQRISLNEAQNVLKQGRAAGNRVNYWTKSDYDGKIW